MAGAKPINVEVTYVDPERQLMLALTVPAGSDVRDVIERSGIRQRVAIDFEINRVGIFGRLVSLDHLVEQGDRVEIYRPLTVDPKEVRRKLAAQGKTMGKKKPSIC